MSRLFDGVDDVMTYAIGASGGLANTFFGTILAVVKIAATADNTWMTFVECEGSVSGDIRAAIGRRNDGNIYYANHASLESTPGVGVTDSDGWMIVAVTKATGTVAGTAHKVIISSGARTSTAYTATQANSTTLASGRVQIGGDADFGNLYMGVAAVMPGIVLTTGQLDGIATAKTTASILALTDANSWVVDDNDGFANDLKGNHNRTAIVGTADDADDPAGWVYGAGGAPTTSFPPAQSFRATSSLYRR